MLSAAIGLARRVSIALGDTLVILLSADEVWDRLRVLRGVGAQAIAASTVVDKGFLYSTYDALVKPK